MDRATDERMMSQLSSRERNYVRSLRKRERADMARLFERDSKRRRREEDVPIRLQVLQSRLPEAVRLSVFDDLYNDSTDKFQNWVRRAIRLPLGRMHVGHASRDVGEALAFAARTMDEASTGHASAKREVLKILCQTGTTASNYALGLEGPPGCGKTHFVKHALAPALARPYVAIPLGGATDTSFLLGSSYTYEGSKEGRLATALVEAECCNPIIHFDEVDKISRTDKGAELEAVLIHLIDPSEPTMRDKYFHGIDIDYSKCTFVFGFNDPSRVNPILLDRIKRIQVLAPTADERVEIVERHLLPRACAKYGEALSLSEGAMAAVMASVSAGEGMRHVERHVEHVVSSASLCRALAKGASAAGLTDDVALLDEAGALSEAFAKGVLATTAPKADAPPQGMYV